MCKLQCQLASGIVHLGVGNMKVMFSVDNFKIINVQCLMCSAYKLLAMEG